MAWTKQQEQAINERGKSILVSAAAGSGKTAVMVERIIRMILDGSASLDEMLIVTFTNAAAQEMKEKIRKALRKQSKEDPKMRRQLELLPQAGISTFHSFALSVIRQNFYLIGMEPAFQIADESRIALMIEDAFDELFDSEYEKGDGDFLRFLDWYSTEKTDEGARDVLKEIYRKIEALPDPFGTLEKAVNDLSEADSFSDLSSSDQIFEEIGKETAEIQDDLQALHSLLSGAGCPELASLYTLLLSQTAKMAENASRKDISGVRKYLEAAKFPRMAAKKAEKEAYAGVKDRAVILRDDAKEQMKALENEYFFKPEEELFSDLKKTAPLGEEILLLLKRFDRIFKDKKREEKLIDFSDIEHDCLAILEHPEAAENYRKKFRYIFIDEYQDTSLIQEAIIQKICRKNNLFMVGDMKQCIYHFRLAEPDIFRGKYESFAEAGPEDPEEKIDLNRNFRSRPVLLSEINRIFEPIMDGYDDNAKLHPGIPYEGEYSFSPQLYLIEKPGAEEDDEEEENPLEKPENREMEARACAKLIKQQAGTLFEDGKTGEIRKLRYRDIVILCRSVSGNAAVYEQVMKEEGIPFYFDDSEGFFDQVEVAVFLNLLSVIDNRYQDVPLLSVLRSEIFGFSSLELAEIRARFPENSYAEAFLKMAEEGKPGVPEGEKGSEGSADTDGKTRSALSEKAYNARNKLEKWKALSLALSLPDFIWRLLTESGYYMMVGAMPNGNARQANLQILAERAENFRSNSEGTLYRFVRYLETLRKRKVSTGQAKLIAENDDVVRLMTIHKSKGLEFPMVIVSGLGQKLRYGSGDSNVFFHKDVGLGLSLMDPEKHTAYPTVLMRLIQAREKQEEYEEQIRILYVAMTRAREKLYLVGVVNDAEKYLEEKELGKQGASSYLSLLKALPTVSALRRSDLFASSEKKTEESEESSEGAPADSLPVGSSSSGSSLGGHSEYFKKKAGIPLQNEVFRRLDYRYPYEDAARIRSKYSVSSINRMFQSEQEFLGEQPGGMSASPKKSVKLAEEEDPVSIASQSIGVRRPRFDVPIFLQGEKKLTQAEKGTVYHGILERIDFDRAGKEGEPYIREFSEDLVKKGVFFENELRELDLHCLSAFFESELGIRARKAYLRSALYREKPFTLRIPHKGENMMIQGIIDCFFVEEDGIVLVDYKSNSLNLKRIEEEKSRMKTAYQEQISLYRRALEKGLDCPVKESYLYLLSAGTSVRMDDPAQKQR